MENSRGAIQLKPGRDKPVRNRHPWIFSGAIKETQGSPKPGDLVDVLSSDGSWLALGYYNAHSQIRTRLLSWNVDEQVDEHWWRKRILDALALRSRIAVDQASNAYRLVNAESDRVPGLIVDRYDTSLVVQALTFGIDRRKELITNILIELLQPTAIIERSDVDVRKKEGLSAERGLLYGSQPDGDVTVNENGLLFRADLLQGHKTGLYLDQRDNRILLGEPRFVHQRTVLNVFSYTGGFALHTIAGGSQAVTNIDSSEEALAVAQNNVERNFGQRTQDEYITGDAFQILREYRDSGQKFDVVVLDPPKFAHSQRDVQSATRGYKDLNWLALRILRPGGLLATFSCSGLVSADLFQKVVFSAATDAGRDAQIIYRLTQSPDHPVLLTFPEGEYLKGLLLHVH